jgi:hypothetical protein
VHHTSQHVYVTSHSLSYPTPSLCSLPRSLPLLQAHFEAQWQLSQQQLLQLACGMQLGAPAQPSDRLPATSSLGATSNAAAGAVSGPQAPLGRISTPSAGVGGSVSGGLAPAAATPAGDLSGAYQQLLRSYRWGMVVAYGAMCLRDPRFTLGLNAGVAVYHHGCCCCHQQVTRCSLSTLPSAHSLTHSLAHPPTHLVTHSPTHPPTQTHPPGRP